jgi:hypothetical protein
MTVKIKKRRQSAQTSRFAPFRQTENEKTRRRFVKSSLLATPRRRLVLLLLISSILSTIPTQKRRPFFPPRRGAPPTIAKFRNLSQTSAQPAKFNVGGEEKKTPRP